MTTVLFYNYHKYDKDDFEAKNLEVQYIVDLMSDRGYTIASLDAYNAWYSGCDWVWEHPFDYDDDTIIREVLVACDAEVPFDLLPTLPPWYDDYYFFTDEEFDSLERELDSYEPKSHSEIEGANPDDFDAFMEKKYH
jgi:hypothetical protein